jgi:hypothetical protein
MQLAVSVAQRQHMPERVASAAHTDPQVKCTRDASEYRDPWRMFGSRSSTGVDGQAFGTAKVAHDTPA